MTEKRVPYVHSNFARVPDDFYPTVDMRCVDALLATGLFDKALRYADVCAPTGSGIVDRLKFHGYDAKCVGDAFVPNLKGIDCIITNPPYTRGLVDKIIRYQIERAVSYDVDFVAVLLRSNFAYAKSRADMFKTTNYAGEVKLLFRPYWSDERTSSPIHNFSWHIWSRVEVSRPIIWFEG